MLVFISHSTKPDAPGDQAYLEELVRALERPEFTLLLDRKSLEGSQEWPREIDLYMNRCHAAVILFSRNALKSDWVLKEAANLSWRRSLEPDFLLFPVTLEGVSPEEIRKDQRFAAMELGRWQFIRPGSPAEEAEQVLDLCRKHIPARTTTPMEKLVRKLTAMLAKTEPAELESAAQELNIPVPEWRVRRHSALAETLAQQLVQSKFDRLFDIFKTLGPLIEKSQATKLVECIKPLWVDAEAAGKIPPVAANRDEPWALGLNGAMLFDFTARDYLNRAYWGDPSIQLITVDSAVGQQTFEEIQEQIEKDLELKKGIRPENQEYYLSNTRHSFFVLLPQPVPEEDILKQLQARFPRMTFLLTTGTDKHDDSRIRRHHRLLLLEPALNVQDEMAAWVLHTDLDQLLERLS